MRFSIRSLLAVMLAAGVCCGVLFAFPHWLGALLLCLASFFLPPLLVAGIVYCRGMGRAFSIGWMSAEAGLFVLISPYMLMAGFAGAAEIDFSDVDNEGWLAVKVCLVVLWLYGIASGFAAAAVRGLAIRNRETAPARPAPVIETSGRADGPHGERVRTGDPAQRRG